MEEMDGKLDGRGSLVLRLVIEDYIETAEPVGSRTISKKMEQSLSPATIRNIMADLEEMGFLAQPHTVGSFRSGVRGGRVPRVAPAAPVAEPPAGVQRQDPAGDRPPGGMGPEPADRGGAGRLRRGTEEDQ